MGKIRDLFAYVNRLRRTEFLGNDNLFTTVDVNREIKHLKDNTENIEKTYELHDLTITKDGSNFKLSGSAFGFKLNNEPIVTDGTSGELNDGNFLVFNCREYDNPIQFEDDSRTYSGAKIIGLDNVYSTNVRPSDESTLYVQVEVVESNGIYEYNVVSFKRRFNKTNDNVEENTNVIETLITQLDTLKKQVNGILPIGTIMPLMPYNSNGAIDISDIKSSDKYSSMLVENGGDWAICDGASHLGSDGKTYETPNLYGEPILGNAYISNGDPYFDTPNVKRNGTATAYIQSSFRRPSNVEEGGGHVVGDLVLKAMNPNNPSVVNDTITDTNTGSPQSPGNDYVAQLNSKVTSSAGVSAWYIIKVK